MPSRPFRRIALALILPTSISLAQSGPGPIAQDAGARERAVLEVLRDVDADGHYAGPFWERLPVPIFETGEPPRTEPRRVGFCGNGLVQPDKARIRALIVRLFRAFDVEPETDAACDVDGQRTTFDVANRDARVAVRLEGDVPGGESFDPPVPPPDGYLGDDRIAKIAAAGWRIVCVRTTHLASMGGVELSVLAPFLARVIEQLDAATPGDDVDVAPLLHGFERRWTLPPLAKGLAVTARIVDETSALEVERTTRLTWPIDAGVQVRDHQDQSRWRAAPSKGSTLGQITIVALPVNPGWIGPGKLTGLTLRVTQGALTVASDSPQILMPSTFDAGKPFTLTAEFAPGHYQVFPYVSVATVR